ncbi:MAG: flagellar biosynthesis protein FliQ [Defluviicoccus sp.]|nr:MAG: flagellar biosynthesis protein FliQ [Defluviicoccus sp.]
MNELTILELGRDTVWTMLLIAGPLLIIASIVGLTIGVLQALTSIQEMTLTFVPKMVAMLIGMVVLLPFMMSTLIEFTQRVFERIALGG